MRLGGMARSYVHDGMVNPLNVTLMHRSHQIPQLQRTSNCLLQLVSPPTKRANYLTTWTCYRSQLSHMPMDRRLGLEVKQGQTIINGLS